MTTNADDVELTTPIPTGPFHANYGPRDGLIMRGEAPVMGEQKGTERIVG